MARTVYNGNACDLPGVPMRYQSFVTNMWSAVRSGHVAPHHADLVEKALRWGVEAGLSPDRVKGCRLFNNYPAAYGEFGPKVAKAVLHGKAGQGTTA